MTCLVSGIDVSLNHGAFVSLRDGKLDDYLFVTDKSKLASKSLSHGVYLKNDRKADKQARAVKRLEFWSGFFGDMRESFEPEYVGVEDYAYKAAQGAHQIGEVGGLLRLDLWVYDIKLRLHDPASLKMFAAHDGSADKEEIVCAVVERWEECREFANYRHGKDSTTVGDLCDAYTLAQLVWLEIQLRRGDKRLSDLHPKEVQVFNRTTKTYPINVLGREWIYRGDK